MSKPVSPQAMAEALDTWLPRETEASITTEAHPSGKTQEPEVQVFDKEGMMARVMHDEDLARTVIEVFLKDTPQPDRVAEGLSESR